MGLSALSIYLVPGFPRIFYKVERRLGRALEIQKNIPRQTDFNPGEPWDQVINVELKGPALHPATAVAPTNPGTKYMLRAHTTSSPYSPS